MISFNGSSLVKTVTKQVFVFTGPVDNLLNIEFSCAINGNSSYSGAFKLGVDHSRDAALKGIYYNSTEDQRNNMSVLGITPFNIADFGSVSNINFRVTLFNGRNQSSGLSILQYPSTSNNYIAKIQVYDPGWDSSGYTFAFDMSFQTTGKVFFNGEKMNRVFFNGTQVY